VILVHLIENRYHWQVLLNAVTNLKVPKGGKFLDYLSDS
jgi:hypothetical protein